MSFEKSELSAIFSQKISKIHKNITLPLEFFLLEDCHASRDMYKTKRIQHVHVTQGRFMNVICLFSLGRVSIEYKSLLFHI